MSISAQKTPEEGVIYLLNRLISDFVGTLGTCDSNIADMAMDATFDCLGSVYPLIGLKGGSKELIGTTVSIGGGYMLAAKHSLNGYLKSYTSYGTKTAPELGIVINAVGLLDQSEVLELQIVDGDIAEGVDLVLLQVTCIDDSRKLKFARFPAFESTNLTSELLSLINRFGIGALFVGFGAMSQTGISQNLQKNDITTFICNQDLAEQTISQLYTVQCETLGIDQANKNIVGKYKHYFLTMGSSQRHPHWNDSGGGLFVFYEGIVYLVGLHYKAIKFGNNKPLTYPLFINLLSIGRRITNSIKRNRVSFLKRSNNQ